MSMGDNMLVKFTVSNYRKFAKPISIDFTQTHDYKFNQECIKDGLLSKVVIYGKNASGKTNFGYALFDIVGLLTDKHTENRQNDPHSFLNADTSCEKARFEYVFRKGSQLITYIYEKSAPKSLCYEELSIDDKIVFSYDFISKSRTFNNMGLLYSDNLNFEYFENNLPILRYIANNTIQPDDSVVRFIMYFVSHMLWFRSLQENGYIGFTTGSENLESWMISNNLVSDFQKFLKDTAEIDTNLDVATVDGPTPEKLLIEKHKIRPLVFSSVISSGTKALQLLFYWSKKFEETSFLFMDEFDAFYHYDLAIKIIKHIVSLNNVQAIFTTHNSFLATNEVMRPDCYFVLENGKLTSFADSTNRELREGHNLEKLLRSGEFYD